MLYNKKIMNSKVLRIIFWIIVLIGFWVFAQNVEKEQGSPIVIDKALKQKLLKTTDNYIKDANTTYGFKAMPVKVFIDNQYYKFMTQKAFHTWQRASDDLVSFEFVTDEKDADLKINFKTTPATDNAYGYSTFRVNSKTKFIIDSTIEIYLFDPTSNTYLPDKMVYSVLIHEIGHSLGIAEHSNNQNDVMKESSPNLNRELVVTNRDINSLRIIYSR